MRTQPNSIRLILPLLLISGVAIAATRTWDGGGANNLWSTAANWDSAIVAGDDLVFPGGAAVDPTSLVNTNNLGTNTAFRSITFLGTNYVLNGNPIVFTNTGVIAVRGQHGSGTNTINLEIRLDADQTFQMDLGVIIAASLNVNGNIDLNGHNLTNNLIGIIPQSIIRLGGRITGTGSIIKNGPGTLRFQGSVANNYVGTTFVNDGILELDKLANNGSIPGPLIIGGIVPALAQHIRPDQIANNAIVTINGNCELDLGQNTDIVGGLVFNGGMVSSSLPGALRLNGDLTVNAASDPAIILGGFQLFNTNSRIFAIADGPASPDLQISAEVSGLGSIIKTGAGKLTLSGDTPNNFEGTVTLLEGILELGKPGGGALPATVGSLVIGDHAGGINTDIVRETFDNQIDSAVPITITASGLLDLNGHDDEVGTLTFIGGRVSTGSGLLSLNSHVTVQPSTNIAYLEGRVALGFLQSPRNFHLEGCPSIQSQLYVSAQLSGDVNLTKTGCGLLTLSGSNSYFGPTLVQQGLLIIDHSFALGSTNQGTTVSSGAALAVRFNSAIGLEALTLNGPTNASFGALQAAFGTNSWAGPIQFQTDSTIQVYAVDPGDKLILGGSIGGPGGFTKIGPGTLEFVGDTVNTYAGSTRVNEGRLLLRRGMPHASIPNALIVGDGIGGADSDIVEIADNRQINTLAPVTVSNSGLLATGIAPEEIGSLAGSGHVDIASGGLSVGENNAASSFSGMMTGNGSLAKRGTGQFLFAGTKTGTNMTFVLAGKLVLDGSHLQSLIRVVTPGALGGNGTMSALQVVAGELAPGSSPGILSCSNVSLAGSGITKAQFKIELNGLSAGSGHDQLKVNGGVLLNGVELAATLGFNSAISNSFIIVDNDGSDPVTNIFEGLPEGGTVNVSGTPFRISYMGGTGNDVVLTQLTPTQRPALTILRNGTNVVLSWPTAFTGFVLESNTNLSSTSWNVVPSAPLISGLSNFVTNNISDAQRSFRLRSP